jgi:hypothetical protein
MLWFQRHSDVRKVSSLKYPVLTCPSFWMGHAFWLLGNHCSHQVFSNELCWKLAKWQAWWDKCCAYRFVGNQSFRKMLKLLPNEAVYFARSGQWNPVHKLLIIGYGRSGIVYWTIKITAFPQCRSSWTIGADAVGTFVMMPRCLTYGATLKYYYATFTNIMQNCSSLHFQQNIQEIIIHFFIDINSWDFLSETLFSSTLQYIWRRLHV